MNRKSVRLVKQYERLPRRRGVVELIANSNQWSKSVRSWVNEFKQRDRHESLPAFDSLFKDESVTPEGD